MRPDRYKMGRRTEEEREREIQTPAAAARTVLCALDGLR
jgi:hypothetical protein